MSITSTKSKKIDEILSYLFDLNRLGIKVGLDHTVELLNRCGNPQNNFQSIHIAGTNGKGSICSMLSSILMNAGYRVGLYSSPHLKHLKRILIYYDPNQIFRQINFIFIFTLLPSY